MSVLKKGVFGLFDESNCVDSACKWLTAAHFHWIPGQFWWWLIRLLVALKQTNPLPKHWRCIRTTWAKILGGKMFGSDGKVLNMKDKKKPGRQSPANLNIAWCGSPPHKKAFKALPSICPLAHHPPPLYHRPSYHPLYHHAIHFHPEYHYTTVPSRIPLYHPLYHYTIIPHTLPPRIPLYLHTTQNTTIPSIFSSISLPSSTTIPPNVSAAFVYFHGNMLILCKSLRAVLPPLAEREKEKDGLREEYFWSDQGKLRESRVSLFAKRSDPVLSH